MMNELKISATFHPMGTAIETMGSSLCFACRHGRYCVMIRAFVKGLKESQAGYQEVVVDKCSLYERDKDILGQAGAILDEAKETDAIIAQAEFQVRGMKPVFRRWIPEVPEGVCHKDILRGLMILVQEKEEPCSS